ncbi:MAG: hypothetical protein UY81_C0047G0001 [Candidatus Giovannonibacteria bacterium GW2011_GWA2_53_7]|uniref:Uncharacterized protein n=1 Tax=Candidatus Giovannonibacteria bacterium GW2011_GWA2_53_7 TaxID=1618650 RepID=A0A0G2AR67_9BACT|nr:MAG: hypothetical protein UY81_C0047G0001 [Candidatus Giovannonibacteria bacterium GW2011_GWA2_53_7]
MNGEPGDYSHLMYEPGSRDPREAQELAMFDEVFNIDPERDLDEIKQMMRYVKLDKTILSS